MPPKGKEAKSAKPKVNLAVEMHADQDLKRLLDNAGAKVHDMLVPFMKTVKAEAQKIKDGEQFDTPSFPLVVFGTPDPLPFDATRSFFATLAGYPWLRQISLLHCGIGDDGVMVIAEYLKQYQPQADRNPFGIEILELPENNITPRGAAYLGRVLTQNESIKTLILDFNNDLGDEGAVLLGDGAKWNSTLERLSLQYCNIGEKGGEAIAKYVVRSSSVKQLSLRGNPLRPAGVTAIARSLAKNAYLVSLDLADTSFGIDLTAVEALRDGIEGNDSLEDVDLNLNSIVPAGVNLLLEMLKQKPKLQRFLLYERISEVVFREALDAVATNIKTMKNKNKKKKGGKGKAATDSAPGTAASDAAPATGRSGTGAPPAAAAP